MYIDNMGGFVLCYEQYSGKRGGRKTTTAGRQAALALNIPRERISQLSAMTDDGLLAAELQSMIEDGTLMLYKAPKLSPTLSRAVLDDIVCFRVYFRHFLSRYMDGEDGAAAYERFCEKLPHIEEQLGRQENRRSPSERRRTVLPKNITASVGFVTEGGQMKQLMGFSTMGQLLLCDMLSALQQGIIIKQCPCCGRYFIPERRGSTYCDGVAAGESKPCSEIGSRKSFERRHDDPIYKLFAKRCGWIYTCKSRGRLTGEQAAELIERCRALREQAKGGVLTVEQLEAELNKLSIDTQTAQNSDCTD